MIGLKKIRKKSAFFYNGGMASSLYHSERTLGYKNYINITNLDPRNEMSEVDN